MLSLKKKREAAAPVVPSWHPNFRNYEKLPDIKVVRTAFFVNAAAITIALAIVSYVGLREWQLLNLNGQIADWQQQIDRDKRGSDQAVAMFRKFQEEERRVREVDAFVQSKPTISKLILRFGETRPKNISLESIEINEAAIVLRGVVRGAPDLAAGEATAYAELLAKDEVLGPLIQSAELTNLSRNPVTGRLSINVVLKFKAAGKK